MLASFVPVAAITAMILSASLASYAPGAGRVLVIVLLALTIAIGGWLTGQWIAGDLDQDRVHPGYFRPTVAGGLIGAFAAAQVRLHAVAEASSGIGIICWLLLGSIVLNRLFFRHWLPMRWCPRWRSSSRRPRSRAWRTSLSLAGPRISPSARSAGTPRSWPWSSSASCPATPG